MRRSRVSAPSASKGSPGDRDFVLREYNPETDELTTTMVGSVRTLEYPDLLV